MKKRLRQSDSVFTFRDSRTAISACIFWSDSDDDTHLHKTIPADIKWQNRKKKSYPLDRLLLRAALRRPSPTYVTSAATRQLGLPTQQISHRTENHGAHARIMDTWSDCACIMKPWACASSWATPFEEMLPHRRLRASSWASRRQRPVSRPVSHPVRHRPCSLRHRLYLHLLRRRRPRRRLRPIWDGRAQSRAQLPCSRAARAPPPRPPRPPASPAARPGGMPVAEGMRPAQASAPSRALRSEGQADGREPRAARLMRVAISGTQWHSGELGAIER